MTKKNKHQIDLLDTEDLPKSIDDYKEILLKIEKLPEDEQFYYMRCWACSDLYFMLAYVLNRVDARNEFVFERCREFALSPYDNIQLWSRGHYKSSIGRAFIVQQIMYRHAVEGSFTVGIFSHTAKIAKAFLKQIKREFEINEKLIKLFPDVLYENPKRESSMWSDEGIIVKRKNNPNEATIESSGLIDGQPTSKHYDLLFYDDIVTLESVGTMDQIKKVSTALKISYNLGSKGAYRIFMGTRYSFADTWGELLEIFPSTIIPATIGGVIGGEPVFLSKEELEAKYKEMGEYVYSCQMNLSPISVGQQEFKSDWKKFYNPLLESENTQLGNRYILCDPAGEKKTNKVGGEADTDYTVFWVIEARPDGNLYVLDLVREKMNLTKRIDVIFALHRKYKPYRHSGVRYEKYGFQSDIEAIKMAMDTRGYRFDITEVGGTSLSKNDRIRRLVPYFQNSMIYFPHTNEINVFFDEEYSKFPFCPHDDMLDALARIAEPDLPIEYSNIQRSMPQQINSRSKRTTNNSSNMSRSKKFFGKI